MTENELKLDFSSQEMMELNRRYEEIQKIAHIGYWFYTRMPEVHLWSKETYRIFGLDPTLPAPSFALLVQMIHEQDRLIFSELVDHALAEGKDFEVEFRIYNVTDKKIHWLYAKGLHYQSSYDMSGVVMDITERKNNEDKVSELNKKMIAISRQAGMSEMAAFVLHNVGNIINSLTVSVELLNKLIKKSEINKLSQITQMLMDNLPKQPDYLVADAKGKLILPYLAHLSTILTTEYQKMDKEISYVKKSIDHIKDIVTTQKNIIGTSGKNEKLFLPEVFDLAIQMSCPTLTKHGIRLIKNYQFSDLVMLDKTKLLQILTNLLINAKDSLILCKADRQKILTTSIKKQDSYIEISVKDNGLGISKDDMQKMFALGFTTKIGGHGFGLYSNLIAAKELNGNLTAENNSEEDGAIFTLKLPETNDNVTNTTIKKGDNSDTK